MLLNASSEPSRRRRARRFASVVLVVTALAAACANAEGTLVVHKSAAASDCPDSRALARSIRAMTPKAPEPAKEVTGDDAVDVTFERGAESYRPSARRNGATPRRSSLRPLARVNASVLAFVRKATGAEPVSSSAARDDRRRP